MANIITVPTLILGNSATPANNFTITTSGTGSLTIANNAATPVTLLSVVYVTNTKAPTQTTALLLNRGGIKFPVIENRSPEIGIIDDYEEGTFTPVFSLLVIGTTSFGVQTGTGKYTKIGKMVTCHFSAIAGTYTAGTGSGAVTITGLPFVADSSLLGISRGFISNSSGWVTTTPTYFRLSNGTATLTLYYRTSGPTLMSVANCATGMAIYGSIVYFV